MTDTEIQALREKKQQVNEKNLNDDISGYSGVSPIPGRQITWMDAIEEIKAGTHSKAIDRAREIHSTKGVEAYKKFKKSLPGVSFGGCFSNRDKKNIITATGFLVADIDHINIADTINKISDDENIHFYFVSPGGDGLKVGLRAEGIQNDKDHKAFYRAVERYFREVYDITIDPACKDISRLTFLSYDPGAYINDDPTFFNASEWTETETPCQVILPAVNGDSKRKYAMKVLQSACDKIRNSTPGSMHYTRLTMGRLVGGYLHYGIESEAIQALEQSVRDSATTNFENAMRTIRAGLENGKLSPVTVPEKQIIPKIETSIPTDVIIRAASEGQKGAAELFYLLFKDKFVFDHGSKQWFEFDHHYWRVETIGRVQKELSKVQALFDLGLAEISRQIIHAGNDRAQTVDNTEIKKIDSRIKGLQSDRKSCRHAKTALNNLSYRRQVAEFAALGDNSLGIAGDSWDAHPWLLPCKNGVVDLKTGKIRDGKPDDFLKSECPTVFDPGAECPNFEKFLFQILGDDPGLFCYVQTLFGAALIGQSTYKQFLPIFSGEGRNGKDTLLNTISFVLGPQLASAVQSELLLDSGARSSQGPSPDKMKLRGLRLAICNETSQGRRFNTGTTKLLTGAGAIAARPLHGQEVTFQQSHLLILMTNSKPHFPPDDYAFRKRIKSIHFPLSFVSEPESLNERKEILNLGEKLKAEASGILFWMLEGCLEFQKKECSLIDCEAVKRAGAEYLKDVDIIGFFIEDCCYTGPGASVTSKELYTAYRQWALEGGHKPLSQIGFSRYMAKRFETGRDMKARGFSGIGLLSL